MTMALASPVRSFPREPGDIRVKDGDTIEVRGATYRLIGFDTPEIDRRARCDAERDRGARATARLKELVAGGGLDLDPVRCSCRYEEWEGTAYCNRGRLCARLSVNGRNVGLILIGEGLAKPLRCGKRRCQKMPQWCSN
jgi:endonuclease YncB( thermonuclease family)